jgi:glycosyltransferase involved in cell wall biosynthesis
VHRHYLLYVGRLEPGKGIPELLAHFRVLRERFKDAPDLVLAGEANMDVSGEGVRYVGRIDEQDKHDALAGALAVVVPSRYESLSLLTLESFAQATPVLVNGRSEVLVGQVERSGAGRTYTDLESFIDGLREVGEAREALGAKGLTYVKKHGWPQVVAAYREEMERILQEKGR